MATRSGRDYALREEEVKMRMKTCIPIYVNSDFGGILQAAFEREYARVFDEDDEDDTDGWELENEQDAAARLIAALFPDNGLDSGPSLSPSTQPSHISGEPFDSPLSSLPSSRATSLPRDSPLSFPLSSTLSSRAGSPLPDNTTMNGDAPPPNGTRRTRRGRRTKKRKQNEKAAKRAKAYGNVKRLKAEETNRERAFKARSDARHYVPSAHALRKLADVSEIQTSFDVEDLHAANGGFIGKRKGILAVNDDLQRHLAEGKRLIKWDGRTSHAIVDKNGRVFALLPAMPNDATWMETIRECFVLLQAAKKRLKFGSRQDRRGWFLTLAYGWSFGGGQRQPGNLRHSIHNQRILDELLHTDCMKRMAGFARSVFATHFPELYAEYADTMATLHEDDPNLRPIFEGGVWPAISINFPPNAFCHDHTDAGNKANGLCPIFALGDYDHTKGGHLVLPDVNLVIEFPPGALIFIPSASLRHGNIPVKEGETRASWTQYAAGGLFRWVRYGCHSWVWLTKHDAERAKREAAMRSDNWKAAFMKFPTMDSLRARATA